jgi:hypothetical protein
MILGCSAGLGALAARRRCGLLPCGQTYTRVLLSAGVRVTICWTRPFPGYIFGGDVVSQFNHANKLRMIGARSTAQPMYGTTLRCMGVLTDIGAAVCSRPAALSLLLSGWPLLQRARTSW